MSRRVKHLFTIWHPKRNPDTIDDHIKVLVNNGRVKWLTLYDCDDFDKEEFRAILTDKQIKEINNQAQGTETLLFMQCLNIFHFPLYAGLIDSIERVDDTMTQDDDPLIPSYYKKVISAENLKPCYAVTLVAIDEVELKEVLNLIPDPQFKSAKFNFPFPCIVFQRNVHSIFEGPKGSFKLVRIESRAKGLQNLREYFVTVPRSEIKLTQDEVDLIAFLADEDGGVVSPTKRQILKATDKKWRELRSPKERNQQLKSAMNRLDRNINYINNKFESKFHKHLIIKYQLNVERLDLQTKKVSLTTTYNNKH
jgi:hypothetical protein